MWWTVWVLAAAETVAAAKEGVQSQGSLVKPIEMGIKSFKGIFLAKPELKSRLCSHRTFGWHISDLQAISGKSGNPFPNPLQSTQAGKPQVAYPTINPRLKHIFCAPILNNLFECSEIL